jgi:hypothetical protein
MSELAFRQWYLNQHFNGDELSLSERVTALDMQTQVAEAIRVNFESGLNLVKMTKELQQYTTQEGLPEGIQNVISAARAASGGDAAALDAFKAVLKDERAIINERLADISNTLPSALTKSYSRLLDAAETLKMNGLDKAVTDAIDKKAASNAFRIANTESSRAYGVGMTTQAMADKDCTGMIWELSVDEHNCEICIERDQVVFPKDALPEYPAHPNCHCDLVLYYSDDINEDESKGFPSGDGTVIPDDFIEL